MLFACVLMQAVGKAEQSSDSVTARETFRATSVDDNGSGEAAPKTNSNDNVVNEQIRRHPIAMERQEFSK